MALDLTFKDDKKIAVEDTLIYRAK